MLGSYGITRVANVTGLDDLGIPVTMAVRPLARSLSVAQGMVRSACWDGAWSAWPATRAEAADLLDVVLPTATSSELSDDLDSAVAAYADGFKLRPDETIDDALAEYDAVAAETETEAAIRGIADLGQAVPVPHGVP